MSKLSTVKSRETGELFRYSRLCWTASEAVDVERFASPLGFKTCDLLRRSKSRYNKRYALNWS